MNALTSNRRSGFTLIEVTMTVMILGIVAASVVPIVFGASDAYANAANVRRTAEKTAYAMERTIRILRDSPEGATRGTIAISTASADQVRFADGHGLELTGTTLYERATDGTLSPLCDQVTSFVIEYLSSDGVTSTLASPTTTQRFNITIVCNAFELRSAAMARVRVVDPA
jgi:prepilin-type N-terminal cleavage/methylation domain-containing protein